MYYHLCHQGVKSESVHWRVHKEYIHKAFYVDMTSVRTTLVLRSLSLDLYKEACTCSTWEVKNVFRFVSFNEPLEHWLHTGKERIWCCSISA